MILLGDGSVWEVTESWGQTLLDGISTAIGAPASPFHANVAQNTPSISHGLSLTRHQLSQHLALVINFPTPRIVRNYFF